MNVFLALYKALAPPAVAAGIVHDPLDEPWAPIPALIHIAAV